MRSVVYGFVSAIVVLAVIFVSFEFYFAYRRRSNDGFWDEIVEIRTDILKCTDLECLVEKGYSIHALYAKYSITRTYEEVHEQVTKLYQLVQKRQTKLSRIE